jgi:hypothetical protein
MRNYAEVIREKERELEVVRKQVEALRMVAPLLVDASETVPKIPPQSEDGTSRCNAMVLSRSPDVSARALL